MTTWLKWVLDSVLDLSIFYYSKTRVEKNIHFTYLILNLLQVESKFSKCVWVGSDNIYYLQLILSLTNITVIYNCTSLVTKLAPKRKLAEVFFSASTD